MSETFLVNRYPGIPCPSCGGDTYVFEVNTGNFQPVIGCCLSCSHAWSIYRNTRAWTAYEWIKKQPLLASKPAPEPAPVHRMSPSELQDLLALAVVVPIDIIKCWTEEQCTIAAEWSAEMHFAASDNPHGPIKAPEFLKPFGAYDIAPSTPEE